MVFQNFNLFPHLTALQNVGLGPMRARGLPHDVVHERALELLKRVGLEHRATAYPRQLSGGEQQRVAIARALAMEPKLMLFDEPTSALDPELVGEVLNVIRELATTGMTMIIVTHELVFARDIADEVAFMDNGIVVEKGVARDVLANPQKERTQQFLARLLS
jgi:polar amino acid transport system ATP-binding protein